MEIHCDNCKTEHQIGDKSINIARGNGNYIGRMEIDCGCGHTCTFEILISEQNGEIQDMDINTSGCTVYKKPNPKAFAKKMSKVV